MSMSRRVWVTMTCCVLVVAASSARADTLQHAARDAVSAQRYCDARFLYEELARRDGLPKYIYNAAESAYAADDRAAALRLYGELLSKAPDFERAANARARVAELGRQIAKDGVGISCERKAKCGDHIVDGGEKCDDGNIENGDGCDSNCTPTGCGNGVVSSGEFCDDGNVIDDATCAATCTEPKVEAPPPPPPPPPPPEEKPLPIAPIALMGGGGAVVVVGGVLATIGGLQYLAAADSARALDERRAAFDAAPAEQQATLLQEANTEQATAQQRANDWNGVGQILWFSGLGASLVGLAAIGAGIPWLLAGE